MRAARSSPVLLLPLRVMKAMAFSSRPARPEHLRAYLDVWLGASVASVPDTRIAAPREAGAPALTVTGRNYLVPTLRLPVDASPTELTEGLQASATLAASFKRAPIIIDLSEWSTAQRVRRSVPALETTSKLHACIAAFREHGLHPVGVANAYTPELQAAALEFGLPCFMSQPSFNHGPTQPAAVAAAANGSALPRPPLPYAAAPLLMAAEAVEEATTPSPKETAATSSSQDSSQPASTQEESLPPHVVQGSVRTGQQVIASEGRSLVVMGNVHSGAEVVADGDIHVYGKLSGRALAGLSGNVKARVFAAKFNAELVAIADCFVTGDQPSDLENLVVNMPTIVSLDEKAHELAFKSF